jgi:Uma2 family endonuclease
MSVSVQPSEIHRVSIEEYHQLVASGGLSEDTHVELIEGWVVDMSPRSPEHENAVRWLTQWLFRSSSLDFERFEPMITGSLTLGDSEPEPDVAILDREPPRREHPSHARLLIEIALTSRDRDLRIKPTIYAPAVDEYWVIDLERSCIVVHRAPVDGVYTDVATIPRGEAVTPTSVPLAPLHTDALFASAFAE